MFQEHPVLKNSLLIIDDNPDTLYILADILKSKYDFVECLSDIRQAEKAIAKRNHTHVILDYCLRDGPVTPTLLRQWRDRYPSIVYLALFTGECFQCKMWLKECDDIFEKPGGFYRLLHTLSVLSAESALSEESTGEGDSPSPCALE
ncbi:MAG: response regulator [Myxococcales bacterium]|jgi:DNA-binding NtrC family response regulator|nr:response regulator [Myxococcales bacterium]